MPLSSDRLIISRLQLFISKSQTMVPATPFTGGQHAPSRLLRFPGCSRPVPLPICPPIPRPEPEASPLLRESMPSTT